MKMTTTGEETANCGLLYCTVDPGYAASSIGLTSEKLLSYDNNNDITR
jgi:hypothetical protein